MNDLPSEIERDINAIREIIDNLGTSQWYYSGKENEKEALKKAVSDLRYHFEKFKRGTEEKIERYQISKIDSIINYLESNFYPYSSRTTFDKNTDLLSKIDEFRKIWPSIKAASETIRKLEISPELIQKLPKYVSDNIMEAVRCYESGCFTASAIMLGRAFEGSLQEKYRSVNNKEPKEPWKCPKCNHETEMRPMSLSKLIKWAKKEFSLPEEILKESNFTRWYRNISAHYTKDLSFDELDIKFIYNLLSKMMKKLFT